MVRVCLNIWSLMCTISYLSFPPLPLPSADTVLFWNQFSKTTVNWKLLVKLYRSFFSIESKFILLPYLHTVFTLAHFAIFKTLLTIELSMPGLLSWMPGAYEKQPWQTFFSEHIFYTSKCHSEDLSMFFPSKFKISMCPVLPGLFWAYCLELNLFVS